MSEITNKTPCESCYRFGCACEYEDGKCVSTDKPFYAPSPQVFASENKRLKEKIQSLESELEQLKKENLAMRNCENCFHFDVLNECNLNSISCIKLDKWEIKK